MENIRLTLVVFICFQLTACAGRYHPVISDPNQSARLRVVSAEKAWAYHLKNQCIPSIDISLDSDNELISALTKTKQVSIGMPTVGLPDYARFEEVAIPAGIPINVAFIQDSKTIVGSTGVKSVSCVIGVRFTPEPGADYQLQNSWMGNNCVVHASRIHPTDKGAQALEMQQGVVKLPPC